MLNHLKWGEIKGSKKAQLPEGDKYSQDDCQVRQDEQDSVCPTKKQVNTQQSGMSHTEEIFCKGCVLIEAVLRHERRRTGSCGRMTR